MSERVVSFQVAASGAGRRVDAFLATQAPGLSRTQAERLARQGKVRVNGRPVPPGRRLVAGETVEVALPAAGGEVAFAPEPLPLDILFEDDEIIVLNKPRGLVVHPGAGRASGTLVNALLAHTPALASGSAPFRPGIVHRLDRDTSGLMVVAKTDAAFAELSQQVRRREVDRRYLALVWGDIREDELLIDVPIGRHLRDRKRMAAVQQAAPGRTVRSARTRISIVRRFGLMTLVEARLVTGRTHQIRVHLAHQGHPVVGDRTYGVRQAQKAEAGLEAEVRAMIRELGGQALHAYRLGFRHPAGGQELSFSTPAPADMERIVSRLGAREG